MSCSIQIRNLGKVFDSQLWGRKSASPTTALFSVDLDVLSSQSLALLGPNGAGKTTLLKILSTLILPDTGTVTIDEYSLGRDDHAIRSKIGFVIAEERSFYWRLTGRQNLEFYSALSNADPAVALKRVEELLGLFKIGYADKKFYTYSAGMKRKFALMRALLHEPEVLFLDEPTKSLDQKSRNELYDLLKTEILGKKTFILATHDLEEAENLCGSFAFLNKGRSVATGTLSEIRQQLGLSDGNLKEIYIKAIGG